MEYLNHTPYHLPNLIVQKWLPFQIKPHKFYTIWITWISHFQRCSTHITELTRLHLNHIPLCCHLMRLHILSIVMVLFCPYKTFPTSFYLFFLFSIQARRKHSLNHLLSDMRHVTIKKLVSIIYFIIRISPTQDSLDTPRHLCHKLRIPLFIL